jgi:hypothetical protein
MNLGGKINRREIEKFNQSMKLLGKEILSMIEECFGKVPVRGIPKP